MASLAASGRPVFFTLSAVAAAAMMLPMAAGAQSTEAEGSANTTGVSRVGGVVVVRGTAPSSLPTRIPTTIESVTAAQLDATVNATDAEDALKFLPSLLVRKRYVGDYNHAVLSTRASGTGNSARSMVFADGVLLSNLLGNGATFTPRWGLVTPEEIERVDVLYGPFSAAYSGNSVGAVVDYVTRMPRQFEAHAKVGAFTQAFDLYNTHKSYGGWQASASLGNRSGDWSWWVNANRLDSEGQPLVFATRLVSAGTPGNAGTAVTGAVQAPNRARQDGLILGTSTAYHTVQDHAKLKLAYDWNPTVRASYTLGLWQNAGASQSDSYLRNAAGQAVYSGAFNVNGRSYAALGASDFPLVQDGLEHVMHAANIKSRTRGVFDWELAASLYDYRRDTSRSSTTTLPGASQGGAGKITNQAGTGWGTVGVKTVWRPQGEEGAHVVDAGAQQETYRLRNQSYNLPGSTANWQSDAPQAANFTGRFEGNTRVQAVFVQDAWRFAPGWATVIGLRLEHWQAWGGVTQTLFSGNQSQGSGPSTCDASTTPKLCTLRHPERSDHFASPKLAFSHELSDEWVLKASTGRALRFPTVSELYQGGVNAQGQAINNNPDLRPERSQTTELSAEWALPGSFGHWRNTFFYEDTRDALYAQLNTATNANTVQNIDRIRTRGLESALELKDIARSGVDLNASVTYAHSVILANSGYVSVPGDTIGKDQPRVPHWRASVVATWKANDRWTTSLGARYSGSQFSTLDNSDPNGFAYQGASKFITLDWRLRYAFDARWSAALGIDNLNNYKYWNFHPYPQRTVSAELRFDL